MSTVSIWHTCERPSYFGKKRDEIQAGYDKKYGNGKWRIAWEIKGIVYDFDTAIELYEDAYYEFLKNQPEFLDSLINTASEVYDNSTSNVDCGNSYHKQENNSNHYQDISVRRCVFRLGKEFRGKKLIQIRHNSASLIGQRLSPGRIKFHLPEYIMKPEKEGWWEKGSVEEFWQSNKILQIADSQNTPEKTKLSDWTKEEFDFILTSVSMSVVARTAFTNKRPEHWKTVMNEIEKEMFKRGLKDKLELIE